MRTTGRWSHPVPVPQFDLACPDGSTIDLDDLRGHVLRILAGSGEEVAVPIPPTGVSLTTIVLLKTRNPAPTRGFCVASEPETWTAFAILSGVPSESLEGAQFLADQNSWLRYCVAAGRSGRPIEPGSAGGRRPQHRGASARRRSGQCACAPALRVMPPPVQPILLRPQHPIDAGPADSQPAGDFRGPDALALSRTISAACRRAVGTRPLQRPSRLVRAIPHAGAPAGLRRSVHRRLASFSGAWRNLLPHGMIKQMSGGKTKPPLWTGTALARLGACNMIVPSPLFIRRPAAVVLAMALSLSTAHGSVARWRRWVAWRRWRLAWGRLGMAWRRLALGAGSGLRISPSALLLCATTGLLLPAASLLPWPRVLPATGSLLSTAVSLRIRPRLLWLLQCASWLWHVGPAGPQQLRHT